MVVFHVVVQDGWPALTASITSTTLQGLLAQRLAQGTHNPWVLGSNPGGPTRFFNRPGNMSGLFFHGISFHLQIACLLISGRPRSAACDAAATKPAHLLRLTPTPRPCPVFRENRRPSTCGFNFVQGAMVGGCRPNVVDGRLSWRASRRAAGRAPERRAAAMPPPAGRAPRA